MNTIHTNFFTGENKYKTKDGKILRNALHKDYAKFLYASGNSTKYDKLALEAAARKYKGPREMEDRAKNKEYEAYVSFYICKVKAHGGFSEKYTPEMVEQNYRDFQTTYSI